MNENFTYYFENICIASNIKQKGEYIHAPRTAKEKRISVCRVAVKRYTVNIRSNFGFLVFHHSSISNILFESAKWYA